MAISCMLEMPALFLPVVVVVVYIAYSCWRGVRFPYIPMRFDRPGDVHLCGLMKCTYLCRGAAQFTALL